MITGEKYDKLLARSRYKSKCKRTKAYCPNCKTIWAYPEYVNNVCLNCGSTLTMLRTGF